MRLAVLHQQPVVMNARRAVEPDAAGPRMTVLFCPAVRVTLPVLASVVVPVPVLNERVELPAGVLKNVPLVPNAVVAPEFNAPLLPLSTMLPEPDAALNTRNPDCPVVGVNALSSVVNCVFPDASVYATTV